MPSIIIEIAEDPIEASSSTAALSLRLRLPDGAVTELSVPPSTTGRPEPEPLKVALPEAGLSNFMEKPVSSPEPKKARN